jgi:hypothetical protein
MMNVSDLNRTRGLFEYLHGGEARVLRLGQELAGDREDAPFALRHLGWRLSLPTGNVTP